MQSIAHYPGNRPLTRERIVARKWAQFYGGMSAYRETRRDISLMLGMSLKYSAADVCAIDQGNVHAGRYCLEFLEVDFLKA